MGSIFPQPGDGEAHTVGVGTLFDRPLHGLFELPAGDDPGPAGFRGDSEFVTFSRDAASADDRGAHEPMHPLRRRRSQGDLQICQQGGVGVKIEAVVIIDKSVPVVIEPVSRKFARVAVQASGEIVREDKIEILDDIENAFSSNAEFFPGPVGQQGVDIPGMLVGSRVGRLFLPGFEGRGLSLRRRASGRKPCLLYTSDAADE